MSCVVLLAIGLCITTTRHVHAGDLTVYINHIQFYYKATSDIRRVEDRTYSYVDGDMVDISCVRLTTNCNLQLQYDFAEEHIGGKGYVAEVPNSSREMFNGIGLRTVLRAAHNNKHIICECTSFQITTTIIDITLVSNGSFSGMTVKLNGFPLRHRPTIDKSTKYVDIEVWYILNKKIRFEYEGNEKIKMNTEYEEKYQRCSKNTLIDVTPDSECCINFETIYNSSIYSHIIVVFRFKPFKHHIYDYPEPTGIPNDNLLQLYGFKNLEYKYEIDKTLSLNCNSSTGHRISPQATTVSVKYNNCFVKQRQMTSPHNNNTTDSYLSNKDNATDGLIEPTTPEKDAKFPYEILVAALGGLCFVVIAVTTFVYFLKRRNNRLQREGSGDNHETQLGNSSPPPYRQKQSHQKNDEVIYSEVRNRSSETPLHAPSPDFTTEEEGPSSEVTYAVLDLSAFSQIANKSATESPYAEVLCGVSPRRCPNE